MAEQDGAELDELDALSPEHRSALAAWADREDPPDDFADAVLAAWVRDDEAEAVQASPARASARRSRRGVGIVAALAAAAAVVVLLRTIPSPAHGASVPVARQCDDPDGPHEGRTPGTVLAIVDAPAGLAVEPPAVAEVGEAPDVRTDALAVLMHHCTPCHDADDPGAQPGALQVYDLRQPRFWLTMSDDQLREAGLRIEQLGAANDTERRSMAAFVDAELDRRARAG